MAQHFQPFLVHHTLIEYTFSHDQYRPFDPSQCPLFFSSPLSFPRDCRIFYKPRACPSYGSYATSQPRLPLLNKMSLHSTIANKCQASWLCLSSPCCNPKPNMRPSCHLMLCICHLLQCYRALCTFIFTPLIFQVFCTTTKPSSSASSLATNLLVAPLSSIAFTRMPLICPRTCINPLYPGVSICRACKSNKFSLVITSASN